MMRNSTRIILIFSLVRLISMFINRVNVIISYTVNIPVNCTKFQNLFLSQHFETNWGENLWRFTTRLTDPLGSRSDKILLKIRPRFLKNEKKTWNRIVFYFFIRLLGRTWDWTFLSVGSRAQTTQVPFVDNYSYYFI